MYLFPQDLIHGAPIGKPVASTAMVTAVYAEEDGTEIHFTRKYGHLNFLLINNSLHYGLQVYPLFWTRFVLYP